MVLGLGLAPVGAAEFLREGIRSLVVGSLAVGVAIYTWPHGPRGSVGAALTKAGLIALALARFHYAAVALTAAGPVDVTWPIAYFAIGDLLVWTLLGAGTVTWLLEQERARVVEGAQARDVLERERI